jgi:hypothetical protein
MSQEKEEFSLTTAEVHDLVQRGLLATGARVFLFSETSTLSRQRFPGGNRIKACTAYLHPVPG